MCRTPLLEATLGDLHPSLDTLQKLVNRNLSIPGNIELIHPPLNLLFVRDFTVMALDSQAQKQTLQLYLREVLIVVFVKMTK